MKMASSVANIPDLAYMQKSRQKLGSYLDQTVQAAFGTLARADQKARL
jgi:hypothetical protein